MNPYQKILEDRNFSNEEKVEVERMMQTVFFYFDKKETQTMNWLSVASFQADALSTLGTTPKVRELALQIFEKIKKFK
ncbi:MAG: hypothetical protein V4504_01695 [Patescibacteria group bacterium]